MTEASCNFQLVSGYGKYHFKGKCKDKDELRHIIEYSPFATTEELKQAAVALYNTGNNVPLQWLRYLIANSTEDLSDFISEHSIEVDSRTMRICNKEGVSFFLLDRSGFSAFSGMYQVLPISLASAILPWAQ